MIVDCRSERLSALTKYLKAVPSAEVSPSSIGTVFVDEDIVKLIEEEVKRTNVSPLVSQICLCLFLLEH